MSRCIDADALKIDFYDEYETEDDAYAYGYVSKHQIDMAPTIDAESVVRCKECKKAHLTYDGDCKYCDEWKDDDDNFITVYHDGNFYCGYGERKEGE